jgi:biotin transport system substrate-specific component
VTIRVLVPSGSEYGSVAPRRNPREAEGRIELVEHFTKADASWKFCAPLRILRSKILHDKHPAHIAGPLIDVRVLTPTAPMNTELLSLRSQRSAWVDRLRSDDASAALQVLGVIGFALITALAAQSQARIYLWEVPITLQTLAVYGSGLYLGWRNGMLAQLLYLGLGMFLPVFAGDGSGPFYLLGLMSAGYLLSYPLAAATIGVLSEKWNSLSGSMLSMLLGSAIVFTSGVVWLHYAAGHASWLTSLDVGFLRFVAIDAAKVLCAGLFYAGTRSFFTTDLGDK